MAELDSSVLGRVCLPQARVNSFFRGTLQRNWLRLTAAFCVSDILFPKASISEYFLSYFDNKWNATAILFWLSGVVFRKRQQGSRRGFSDSTRKLCLRVRAWHPDLRKRKNLASCCVLFMYTRVRDGELYKTCRSDMRHCQNLRDCCKLELPPHLLPPPRPRQGS